MKKQRGYYLMNVLMGCAVVAILAAAVLMPAWSCHSQGKIMKLPTQWGIPEGCMVEHQPGKWVPMDRYRVVD